MLFAITCNPHTRMHALLAELDEIDHVATATAKQTRRSEILEQVLEMVAIALKTPAQVAGRAVEGRWY